MIPTGMVTLTVIFQQGRAIVLSLPPFSVGIDQRRAAPTVVGRTIAVGAGKCDSPFRMWQSLKYVEMIVNAPIVGPRQMMCRTLLSAATHLTLLAMTKEIAALVDTRRKMYQISHCVRTHRTMIRHKIRDMYVSQGGNPLQVPRADPSKGGEKIDPALTVETPMSPGLATPKFPPSPPAWVVQANEETRQVRPPALQQPPDRMMAKLGD